MMANAPKQSGASGASAPPAIITSASPRAMARNPSPIAMAPDAQLMPLVELGPVQPNSIAMLQLAAPANTVRARAGSTSRTPPRRKLWYCRSPWATPPSAVPIIAPTRSRVLPLEVEVSVGEGHARRRDGELGVAVQPARAPLLDVVGGMEPVHLAGDPGLEGEWDRTG